MVQSYAKKYSNALVKNIDDRFPLETLNVLDAFSIFNFENMPGVESYDFQMYCSREINVLADHYYVDDDVKRDALEKEFDSFKFELIELRKKWNSFKDNFKSNKLKLKCTATEWGLRTIFVILVKLLSIHSLLRLHLLARLGLNVEQVLTNELRAAFEA